MSFYQLFGMSPAERMHEADLDIAHKVGKARYKETKKIYESAVNESERLENAYNSACEKWDAEGQPDYENRLIQLIRMRAQVLESYKKLDSAQEDYFYCMERMSNINAMI